MGRVLTVLVCTLLSLGVIDHPIHGHPLNVLVSISPYRTFVTALGKSNVSVDVLLPQGTSDETFDPTIAMLKKVSHCQILIVTGKLPLEKVLLARLSQLNPHIQVINLGLQHPHETDPHLWMSVRNLQKEIPSIAQALSAADPQHQAFYHQNLIILLSQLHQLDQELQATLKSKSGHAFVITHPTLGYFARDYGLIQLALDHEEGKSTPIKAMQDMVREAKIHRVRVVISQIDTPAQTTQLLSQWLHATVIPLNPMSENYVAQIRFLASQFRDKL